MRGIQFSKPTGWTFAIALVASGCKRTEQAAGPSPLVIARAPIANPRPCTPAPALELVDVRREPRALVAAGDLVYWIDWGHFADDAFAADGGLWRMTGIEPVQIARDLGAPSDLAIAGDDAIIAEAGRTGGIRIVTLGTGASRWLTRIATEQVAADGADIYAASADALVHLHDGRTDTIVPIELATDLAITKTTVVLGEATAASTGVLTILARATGAVERFSSDQIVHAISDDASHLGVGGELVAWTDRRGRARARAADEIRDIVSDGHGLAWLATGDRRFEIIVDDRVLVSRPMIGHLLVSTPAWLYWVESTPVADPYTKEPTPYRIGRVARDACS